MLNINKQNKIQYHFFPFHSFTIAMKKMNLEGKNIHFVVEELLERTMHILEFMLCVGLDILFLHNSCKPLEKINIHSANSSSYLLKQK